jgi:cyclopropane-fatty-acyl-phospholipid synthase
VTALPRLDAAEAAEATNIHYEQPAELFEAFLGRHMKYTCALFSGPDDSLDDAQEAYLRVIARQLGLSGGERVLDVGCGWGSLSLFLAGQLGCHVVAVTPSRVQAGYVRRRAAEAGAGHLVRVETGPFQTVAQTAAQTAALPERSFDAVAMVEVIEHLPEHRQPLERAYRLLRRGGRLFLSASCYRSRTDQEEFESRPASLHALRLYGFTAMSPLSQLLAEVEDAGFSIAGLIDTTAHYGPTMDHWQRGIERNLDLMEAVRPGFAGELVRYFDTARASWGYTAKHYAVTAVRSRLGHTELP